MKDALNRRSRFAPPQPGEPFELQEGDHAILRFLGRHGKLHAKYLYEATKHIRTDETYLVHRLGELYNGYIDKSRKHVTFLGRDHDQFAHFEARYRPLVHELPAPTAKYRIGRSGSFIHDFFTSCFTASAELLEPERFIFRDDIIDHPNCPAKASTHPFTLRLDQEGIEPDDIFGLSEGTKRRIFFLEADCATERVSTDDPAPSSITRKVKTYLALMQRDLIHAHFGFRRPFFLFATSSTPRVDNIAKRIAELVPEDLRGHFLAKAFPHFTRKNWTIPSDLLDVYTGWTSTKGLVDINKKAPG